MFRKSVTVLVIFVLLVGLMVTVQTPKSALSATLWVNVQDLPYNGPNANVSQNSTTSLQASLGIDSLGRPHVAWVDDGMNGATDIFYVKWNGTQWVNAQGQAYPANSANISNTRRASVNPSLALDANDRPHIVWCDGTWGNNYELVYVHWNGTNWLIDNNATYDGTANCRIMPSGSNDSFHPSLRLDSNGLPHVSFERIQGARPTEVCYGRLATAGTSDWVNHAGVSWTGANVIVSQTTNAVSEYPSLALDSSNRPHISWQDRGFGASYEIAYVRSNGTNWLTASGAVWTPNSPNVSKNIGVSIRPSLEIDSNDRPHIAWSDNTSTGSSQEIYYVRWDGSNWVDISGAGYSGGSNANITNNFGDSLTPSLELDNNNNPHISWSDLSWSNEEMCYMYWNGTGWVGANRSAYDALTGANVIVSANTGLSQAPHLILDAFDMPHIAWQDNSYNTNWEILYVRLTLNFTATVTMTKAVDSDGDDDYADDGAPVPGGATLSYRINWSINNPDNDPLVNAFITDIIPNGSSYIAGSATPTANLSYSTNGGASWIPGEPPNGSPGGTILRWTITSNANQIFYFDVLLDLPFNPAFSPVCNSAVFRHRYDRGIPVTSNRVCNTIGNIGFTKIASKSDYFYEEDIVFTLRVDCRFGAATNVVVTDTFPVELIYISSTQPVSVVGNVITWNVGNMALSDVATCEITFRLISDYQFGGTPLTVTNNAVCTTLEYEPIPGSATVTIHKTELIITKTVNKQLFTKKETVVFNIIVRNLGTEQFTGVVLTDEFPSVLTLLSSTPPPTNTSEAALIYNIGTVLPGEIYEFELSFAINENKIMGEETLYYKNTAILASNELEPLESEAVFAILRPKTVITKVSRSLYYKPTDLLKFIVTISNVGGDVASEVNLYDFFPHEFEFVSAKPTNAGGKAKIWYKVGDLEPGKKLRYEFTFKIADPVKLPRTSNMVLTNTAKVSALGLPDKYAYASIILVPDNARRELSLVTIWNGIDTKTSVGKVNQEIELTIICKDGSSPYEVTVDFGEGGAKEHFSAENEEPHTVKHTYSSPGEYTVVISCDDAFGLNTKVVRKITIR